MMQKNIEGTISSGPWGDRGRSTWSCMTNRGINQIVINVGLIIISFRDTTELESATFGGKNPDETKTALSYYKLMLSIDYGFHQH
uniref:Jacalin-type lectin domain-containing protein n=1 Tax=Salix viminalis TaxID=40686 RepID=A0A6N2KDX6_SALVM